MSPRAAAALIVALGAALVSFRGIYEPDLWWHLAQGREAAAGHLLRTNAFSFLFADYRQPYTPWLFDAMAFLAWKAGGGLAIQALQALLLAAALGLVYAACRLRGSIAAAAVVVFLGFFVIEPRAIPRPHLVSFAGMAAAALAVERAAATRSVAPLIWMIPAAALWSNFHVEVIFGVLLLGVAAVSDLVLPSGLDRPAARRALAAAAACGAAALATPYGWGLLAYAYENNAVPTVLAIAELQRPDLITYRAFYAYIGIAAVLLLSAPRRLTLREAVPFVLFAALGCRYARLTPLVFLTSAPAVTARLQDVLARGVPARAAVGAAIVLGLALSRVPPWRLVTGWQAGDDAVRPPAFFSERAVAFARQAGLDGSLFNSQNLGGYVAWSLYPSARVLQDTRLQAYPPAFFLAIVRASQNQEDWNTLVSGVDWAMLSLQRPNQLSGAGRFPRQEWATVSWDEAIEVLVRRQSRFAAVAAAHEYTLIVPGADPLAVVAKVQARDLARREAERNRLENPRGLLAPAVLCLMGDAARCAELDRRAIETPTLRPAIDRVRRLGGR